MFKNLMNKLYKSLVVLLHPSFWTQLYANHPYSTSFDKWCLESLENGCDFEEIETYAVKFNGRTLWIANDELCCFRLYEKNKPRVQPSRYTKILMWKKFKSFKRAKQLAELEGWK